MNKKFNGFDISVDDDGNFIFVNFDKNGRAGGYISIRLDDEEIIVDAFNGEGDVIGGNCIHWEELEPTKLSHEDPRL